MFNPNEYGIVLDLKGKQKQGALLSIKVDIEKQLKELQESGHEAYSTCSICKSVKLLKEFCKDKEKRNGVSYRCKECTRKKDMERRGKTWKEIEKNDRASGYVGI